jgi:hypothetical protein
MAKQIPASCAEVDLAAVERELIRTGANVSATAKTMGVPVHDLRLLTRAIPRLIEAALEAEERAIDEAVQVLRDGLRHPDMNKRLVAAAYFLRHTEAGRRRGWGRHRALSDQAEPQHVILRWLDEPEQN